MNFFIPKARVLGLSVGEDFVILACVVFTQCQRVTDGRTDRQTDGFPTIAITGIAATLTPCKNASVILNNKLKCAKLFSEVYLLGLLTCHKKKLYYDVSLFWLLTLTAFVEPVLCVSGV